MHEREIAVRGGLITTSLFSEGSGEPLLYLHWMRGLAGSLEWLDDLTSRFEVFAPLHPGYGGSSNGAEQLDDVWDFALFYFDLLDQLGLNQVHLVAHSMGGMIAAEMAVMNSQRFKSLTLIDPAGLWLDEHPIGDFYALPPEQLRDLLWAKPDSEPARAFERPPQEPDEIVEQARGLAASTKLMWPLPDKRLIKRIHRIKTPTLIVWGERDGYIAPAYGEEFRRRIAGARLVMLADAGHLPMVEQPAQLRTVLLDFIASLA